MHLLRRDIAQLAPPAFCARIALLLTILSISSASAQGHSPLVSPNIVSTIRRTLHSQRVPVLDGDDIRFSRKLSTGQGLSQTQVAQIMQVTIRDSCGSVPNMVWTGFDGYEFRVFTHDSARENSLSCVYIHSLFKDRSGTLWVGCDQFLDRFDSVHETFTHYRIDAGGSRELCHPNQSGSNRHAVVGNGEGLV